MNLHWKTSIPASALHAAARLIQGRAFVDPALQSSLAAPAAELNDEITAAGLPPERFLANLSALAAAFDGHRELAEVALIKTIGRDRATPLVERFAGRIADVEMAFQQAIPDVAQQLELRTQPLREQWESRGPGLLAGIGRLIEPGILVDEAEVILVYPASGGGGRAHVPYNSVRIEAVLTNPDPQLPEVLRLGWLLAQLQLDLSDYQGMLNRDRAEFVGSLALLPAVLAAAEDVELARLDRPTLTSAISAWDCLGSTRTPSSAPAQLAETLSVWWETHQAARPRWPVALAALDRLLGGNY